MAGEVPVYETVWMQEAHRVRDRLVRAGIWAEVVSPVGSAVGEETRVQVLVSEATLAQAREVLAAPAESGSPVEGDKWPLCPQCEARRTAVCPICKSTSIDFPEPDDVFVAVPNPLSGAVSGKGCDGDSGACARKGEVETDEEGDQPSEPPWMLLCTTCDEPFVPRFAARCGGCDHVFDDGLSGVSPIAPETADGAEEFATGRVLAVFGALALLALATAAYFAYLFQ